MLLWIVEMLRGEPGRVGWILAWLFFGLPAIIGLIQFATLPRSTPLRSELRRFVLVLPPAAGIVFMLYPIPFRDGPDWLTWMLLLFGVNCVIVFVLRAIRADGGAGVALGRRALAYRGAAVVTAFALMWLFRGSLG